MSANKAEVLSMLADGVSQREINRRTGVSRKTLYRWAESMPKPDAAPDELHALRREVKQLRAESADLSAIKRCIGTVRASIADQPAWLTKHVAKSKQYWGVPTLFLSDLHFGEVVYPAQVNGRNEYNTPIAIQRLRNVVSNAHKILQTTLSGGSFGGAVVILGGDMVDGVIHDELRDTSDETVMQSVVTVHDQLLPALKQFADEYGRVHVPCVAGNHGRLDRKPRMKNGPQLNFDWLLYQFLAKSIGDSKYRDRVTFQIPDGFDCSYRVHGVRYLLTHGDSFKGGSGITGPLLPWMRGEARTRQQYDALGLPYDVLCMGHWHQLRYLDSIIVNGCLPGFNEYALKNRFAFERPQQALWLTHPKHGRWLESKAFAEDSEAPEGAEAWCEVRAAA
jgi:predicted phosphodiesterase